ncbi:hypothetical protein BKI52_07080 [marine bacterium AO1-C]|nr:hypothetical protein BKI52_07080 [marine bacterium AO1-C]
MKHNFQIKGIDRANIEHLFQLDEAELAQLDAVKMMVDHKPGFPCRVSLQDAEIGEEVLLFSYDHLKVASPYKGHSPVFVRQNATTAQPQINEVPVMLRHRLLSVRAFDEQAMMQTARTVKGEQLEDTIDELFDDAQIQFLQVHNAGPGCYNCAVERV